MLPPPPPTAHQLHVCPWKPTSLQSSRCRNPADIWTAATWRPKGMNMFKTDLIIFPSSLNLLLSHVPYLSAGHFPIEKLGNYPRPFLFHLLPNWSLSLLIPLHKELINPFLLHLPQFRPSSFLSWKMAIASPERCLLSLSLFPATHLPCCSQSNLSKIFHVVRSRAWISSISCSLLFSRIRLLTMIKKVLPSLPLCPISSYLSTLLPKHLPLATWNSSPTPGHSLLFGASKPLRMLFSSAWKALHLLYLENFFLGFKTKLKHPLLRKAFSEPCRQNLPFLLLSSHYTYFPILLQHVFDCFAFILQVMSQSVTSNQHTTSNRVG